MKLAMWLAGTVLVLGVLAYAVLELSPWPSVLVYRWWMNHGGIGVNQALLKHVPPDIEAQADEPYIAGDADATLDVYHPASVKQPLPTVVWIHGGGFLAGDKQHVANYLKILAGRGYTTVAVSYSLAPASTYPTPVRQVNAALVYLTRNAERLHVDPERIFLAGDSAGAQLAAQVANMISAPPYAQAIGVQPLIRREQLRGVILHCGIFDLGLAKFDGPYGHFMRTIVWSYSGRKEFGGVSGLPAFSLPAQVTAQFPPAFISVGNADALVPHSRALADALTKQGVKVDTLFFPADYRPPLPHEYQFNLDSGAGREALERTVRFLKATAY
jgi:acetyl esterase